MAAYGRHPHTASERDVISRVSKDHFEAVLVRLQSRLMNRVRSVPRRWASICSSSSTYPVKYATWARPERSAAYLPRLPARRQMRDGSRVLLAKSKMSNQFPHLNGVKRGWIG